MEWYINGFKNYATFDGRARREEYWMFHLFNFLVGLAIVLLELVLPSAVYLRLIYSLAVFIPSLAVSVRRLHDINKSGWWYFINMVPLIGGIWFLVLMCTDSETGSNQYGPNPKVTPKSVDYEESF